MPSYRQAEHEFSPELFSSLFATRWPASRPAHNRDVVIPDTAARVFTTSIPFPPAPAKQYPFSGSGSAKWFLFNMEHAGLSYQILSRQDQTTCDTASSSNILRKSMRPSSARRRLRARRGNTFCSGSTGRLSPPAPLLAACSARLRSRHVSIHARPLYRTPRSAEDPEQRLLEVQRTWHRSGTL